MNLRRTKWVLASGFISWYFIQLMDPSNFQHCQCHVTDVGNAVLAQCAMEFVHADMLPGHVRFDSLSVVNQKAGLACTTRRNPRLVPERVPIA